MSDAYDAQVPPPGWESAAQNFVKQGVPSQDAQRLAIAQRYMQQGYQIQDALMMAERLIAQSMQRTKPIGLQPGQGGAPPMPTPQQAPNPWSQAQGLAGLLGKSTAPAAAPPVPGLAEAQGFPLGFNVGGT